MPMKSLQERDSSRMKVLGYITTGIKVKNKNSEGTHPEQVDHFVLPEKLQAWFAEQGMSTEPKSLTGVFLISDDPDKAFNTGFNYIVGHNCICRGDDVSEKAIRRKHANGKFTEETEEVVCKGYGCKYAQPDEKNVTKCKPSGNLYIVLQDYPVFGVWGVKAGGASITAIWDELIRIRSINGGHLTNIPFRLDVEPFVPTKGPGKGTTKYKVVPSAEISVAEMMRRMYSDKPKAQLGGMHEEYESEVPEDDDDDAIDGEATVVDPESTPKTTTQPNPASSSADGDDPFGDDTDVDPHEKIAPAEVKTLEALRNHVLTDIEWGKLLHKFGVTETADLPKKFPYTVQGEDRILDVMSYIGNVIKKVKADKDAATKEYARKQKEAPAMLNCTSCLADFSSEVMLVDDSGKPICPDCMKFRSGLPGVSSESEEESEQQELIMDGDLVDDPGLSDDDFPGE